ncbi:hypothetical protein N657DRAFT_676007 [Parathielavia appendiculata]|uniref:Uncharacterized protein n=1 Tax=Parathielavia appendiculata TaxID=2587402 RepID=A0AAN6Z8H3_9PEZI|nr:hypothetical protein N657DRAFT_676007 [Parathielavia appendiculata]
MIATPKTKLPGYEEQLQRFRHHKCDGNTPCLRCTSRESLILLNPKTRRIRWTLSGPLEIAVTVTGEWPFDPDEFPFTKPKVSSLKVSVDPLDHWDHCWMEMLEGHTDADGIYDPTNALYGRCWVKTVMSIY